MNKVHRVAARIAGSSSAVDMQNYELVYPGLEAFADSIDEWGKMMIKSSPEIPDPDRAISVIKQQSDLVRSISSQMARLDAELLKSLGEDLKYWKTPYPELP